MITGTIHTAFITTSVSVTSPESMSTRQGNNIAIIETHTVEYSADMIATLGRIGQTAIRRDFCWFDHLWIFIGASFYN
jgi:hypothetical protein